jgi:hypothetical protein
MKKAYFNFLYRIGAQPSGGKLLKDYIEFMNDKRKEAAKQPLRLMPFIGTLECYLLPENH